MTTLNETGVGDTRAAGVSSRWIGEGQYPEQTDADQSRTNVGAAERAVSVAAGSILALQGISRGSIPGLISAAIGGMLIYRGASGHCSLYEKMNINTAESSGPQNAAELDEEIDSRGIHIEQAFLINRSAEDLYNYWRNFENLPKIMTNLERVTVMDERRSHWAAKAPRLAGGSVEWDAEITSDERNSHIAWRSLPGSDIDTVGQIRFSPAMGDRGTEVHVFMDYVPPAGKLGHVLAKLFGSNPRTQMREDLRNFKRLMETGEIPTIIGQPRGTCTGEGKREGE